MLFSHSSNTRIVLGLQGGGSHGAFTWGVLDYLFEQEVEFAAISGVSSGAMNAVMAVQGLVRGGPEGARAALREFWSSVGSANVFNTISSPMDWLWGWDKGLELGSELAWNGITNALRMFNPGQLNPLGQNPLEPLLDALLDPKAIRSPAAPRLYVGATDVETGESTVFSNAEIGVRHLLASACIPMMFPAVEVGGRHYWDGGYSCNPPLAPVLSPRPDQLVLVRAQPRRRKGVPATTADIVHRLHEIAFQAPLEAELSMLPRHTRLLDISADHALARYPLVSKMNTERGFLENLFTAGRDAAKAALPNL
jgi:NTE family protein